MRSAKTISKLYEHKPMYCNSTIVGKDLELFVDVLL